MPASRNARAMIFAPRSCPSSPGLATTTRILRVEVAAAMRVILARGTSRGRSRSARMIRVLASLALPLELAAPAAAAPVRLGTSLSAPLVDAAIGRVVWQPDPASIGVLDLDGAGLPRSFGLPAGCSPGAAGALRGDRLVLDCPGVQRLLELSTGVVAPVPGAEAAGIG